MTYLPHSETTITSSFSLFARYHYPTATLGQCEQLLKVAFSSYCKHRGWLSHLNSDIDEEAIAMALRTMHSRAWYIELPYRAGNCNETRLLKRVQSHHSTGPRKTYTLYQPSQQVPAGMATLTVPAEQVPFLKQQLEVMALLDQ
jgi:hypothetical protein